MIEIPFAMIYDTPDECTNAGPCCFSCPHFDLCDHRYNDQEN